MTAWAYVALDGHRGGETIVYRGWGSQLIIQRGLSSPCQCLRHLRVKVEPRAVNHRVLLCVIDLQSPSVSGEQPGERKHAMAMDIPAVREVVERVFARQDVLDACRRRDLSTPITVLCANGVTQAQIATLTGIPQGRISEYKTRKRIPIAMSTFEAFASLGLPPAARHAFGLAPVLGDVQDVHLGDVHGDPGWARWDRM